MAPRDSGLYVRTPTRLEELQQSISLKEARDTEQGGSERADEDLIDC